MDGITEAGYQAKAQLKLLSSEDKKDASSKEEKKPLQLAITSSYAGHCARVMNKVQKLISLQVHILGRFI